MSQNGKFSLLDFLLLKSCDITLHHRKVLLVFHKSICSFTLYIFQYSLGPYIFIYYHSFMHATAIIRWLYSDTDNQQTILNWYYFNIKLCLNKFVRSVLNDAPYAPYTPKFLTRLTRQYFWRALRANIFDAPYAPLFLTRQYFWRAISEDALHFFNKHF